MFSKEDNEVVKKYKEKAMEMAIDTYLSRSRYLLLCKARLLDEAGRLGLGIVSYTQMLFFDGSKLRSIILARKGIHA